MKSTEPNRLTIASLVLGILTIVSVVILPAFIFIFRKYPISSVIENSMKSTSLVLVLLFLIATLITGIMSLKKPNKAKIDTTLVWLAIIFAIAGLLLRMLIFM